MPHRMGDEAEALRGVFTGRGHRLGLHGFLYRVSPSLLRTYDQLARETIFRDEPNYLDEKTRFLILVGITTALARDEEGLLWSSRLAMEHGATPAEVCEALSLTLLPGGAPVVERAARVLRTRGVPPIREFLEGIEEE